MLEGALGKVAGYLDKRLVLTVLFPTLVFWSALAWLIGGHIGWQQVLNWWKGLAVEQQVLLAVAAVAGVIFFASAVSINIGWLTRLFEGYWPGRSWLGKPGTCLQRWRHRGLDPAKPRDFERRYRQYPRRADHRLYPAWQRAEGCRTVPRATTAVTGWMPCSSGLASTWCFPKRCAAASRMRGFP